ncbi:UDP-N-acetylmuramoyl-L-alanine--D-glutamate ligase [Verrucomicrobia bacterium]|nr:UDP-N-acetylmuramoyl-L-alanine--D-glutamate ligase [Verrucomicrobiota bacterium]MDB4691177.1 UDP-N-acetylmuramoyl-L-alanine--D-glutamate ligase [Verrucomicrobiota bacterium]MDB4718110.1 UDP-N-acetylmuramoyl-L-alanine--D-glutamate ligase [Verrucomicrobiota bacterium]
MAHWKNKKVIIVGLGKSGLAALQYLAEQGAKLWAIDSNSDAGLLETAKGLEARGISVTLGQENLPMEPFDIAVLSPDIAMNASAALELKERNIPCIGELELGYQAADCLNIGITGTNGKTTTSQLVGAVLESGQRKTMLGGDIGVPLCSILDQTKALDFLTLEVSSFQLETTQFFRPSIGILLNLAPDHQDRYSSFDDYCRIKSRLFQNQQSHDWGIIQSEAMAKLRSLDVRFPGKMVTFSAENRRADVFLDRGLVISQIKGWSGPLLNMADCELSGPHNAENIMAALLVGRTLRIPLDAMKQAIQAFKAPAHRGEWVMDIGGVRYINDSKATNPHATVQVLRGISGAKPGEPNVWLIAGGDDKGLQYHDLGPIISQKVKGAFLIGKSRERLRAAWSLFAPCQLCDDLVEAVSLVASKALPSDVVLLSPACSSLDMFRNFEERGEVFRNVVTQINASGSFVGTSEQAQKVVVDHPEIARSDPR